MKRFFKWYDDDLKGTTYIEIDNDVASKQIAVTSNKYIASNRKDEEHHFYLAEEKIDENEIIDFGGSEISENQFYNIWNKFRDELCDNWHQSKEKFPIGSEIEGIIEVFYPEGVIIGISPDIIGITDYNKCRISSKRDNLYPRHKIIGKVVGYDEDNMWLIIDNPKVF
ncbi:hypothetical protein LCL95_17865 [Bacillus timonensis]|nr:hypothetical protein [Bacillus timonensis]